MCLFFSYNYVYSTSTVEMLSGSSFKIIKLFSMDNQSAKANGFGLLVLRIMLYKNSKHTEELKGTKIKLF